MCVDEEEYCVCSERIGSLQIPRIHLQSLVKCLDQKVSTVRQQSTGSSLLVLSASREYCVCSVWEGGGDGGRVA